MLTCDTYLMPRTLAEALEIWSTAPEGSRLVAGATDILPWAREGRAGDVHLPMMLDVTRVAELQGYSVTGDKVRLGANVVYQQFLEDAELIRLLPNLPYCAAWFADDQIRQQATLVGNVVNASPAGDGIPPVLTHDGTIELARLEGGEVRTRSMAIADFITGPGKTDLAPGEIATSVTLDAMPGYGGSFQKVGQRRSLVISAICCAGLVKTDGQVFEDVRLALGGIGPRPIRLYETEKMLKGQPMTRELVARASVGMADLVASRSRIAYRRAVVGGFVEAAIEDALVALGAPKPTPERRETSHV